MILLLFAALSVSAGTPVKGPMLEFEKGTDFWDFGRIAEGPLLRHSFKLLNKGTEDLVIERIIPSCKCISPAYTSFVQDKTIKPGRSTSVSISYDTVGRRGIINNFLFIESNDARNKTRLYTVKGEVEMQFPEIDMFYTAEPIQVKTSGNKPVTQKFYIKNTGAMDILFKGSSASSDGFTVTTDTDTVAPGQREPFYVNAKPGTLADGTTKYIYLKLAIPFSTVK